MELEHNCAAIFRGWLDNVAKLGYGRCPPETRELYDNLKAIAECLPLVRALGSSKETPFRLDAVGVSTARPFYVVN